MNIHVRENVTNTTVKQEVNKCISKMLAAGEYSSAAEYDILLALARDEHKEELAREEAAREYASSPCENE